MTYAARLVAGTVLVLAITILLLSFGVERTVRSDLEADIRGTLERQATLIKDAWPSDSTEWEAAAARLATVAGVRVTVIDRGGRVRAESNVPPAELDRIENHGSRPEVRAALSGHTGWNKRSSATIGTPLMYVAIPGGPGVIRVALPLTQVEATVRRSQQPVWIAAGVALALGGLLALLAGRRLSEPLTEIRSAARAITQGATPTFPRSGIPDVDALASDLREVHQQLATRIEGLKRTQAETTAIVDSMVEGVLSSDARGRVVIANPAARRLLGYGERDQLPDLALLFRAKDAREAVMTVLGGAPVSDKEVEIGDKICLLNARPTAFGGVVIVLHDLTRVRRLETVRRDFVANVSHELKTPLTAISGYAETLLDDGADRETQRRFLTTILSNARRMQRLVDDQLDLSRIESGAWIARPEPVGLRSAIEEAWTSVVPPSGVVPRLEIELGPNADVLPVDPDALRQILRNLFENAIRHTPSSGAITVRSAAEANGIRVSVIDSGTGIPSENLPRIFERFYRVDAARSREQGGTGLGLSIVKHLVEAHRGRVSAESSLGQGTAIHLWFES